MNEKTTPVTEEKTFTQEDVNRIVSERLAKEKAKYDTSLVEREQELLRREALLEAKQKSEELEGRFDALLINREFAHSYVRAGVLADFQKAIADEGNKGKSDAELFDILTKDQEGIFKSQCTGVNMGGIGAAATFTVDNIRKAMGIQNE